MCVLSFIMSSGIPRDERMLLSEKCVSAIAGQGRTTRPYWRTELILRARWLVT